MIKKVFVLLLSFVMVISLFVFNNAPIFKNYADEYEVYLNDFSCSNSIIRVDKNKFPFIFNAKGQSAVIKKENFYLENFLLDFGAKLVFVESGEDYSCYYAYSPNFKQSKIINEKKVNLHIAIKKDSVKVGSPIIYGSF